jgi:hypothetical protein
MAAEVAEAVDYNPVGHRIEKGEWYSQNNLLLVFPCVSNG